MHAINQFMNTLDNLIFWGYVLMILFLVWAIWYLIVTTPKKRVVIGINPQLDQRVTDGFVWVKAAGGGLVKKPFMAARPELLGKPLHHSQIADIFWQVANLGMNPEKLEIIQPHQTVVYQYGVRKPVVVI